MVAGASPKVHILSHLSLLHIPFARSVEVEWMQLQCRPYMQNANG
jgi:hypothetical protein